MRKATKTIISFAVILIAGLNLIVPAFAQDPFSAVAIGGITGASGAGLFGSMAGMSGINIGWSGSGSDPMDAMWNVLNPDHVYFSGEKHEATGQGEDVWDYITVDLQDWLQAQSDFIVQFAQDNNVTDNSSGSISESYFDGLTFNTVAPWAGGSNYTYPGTFAWCLVPSTVNQTMSVDYEKATLSLTCTKIENQGLYYTRKIYYDGNLVHSSDVVTNIGTLPIRLGLTYYKNNTNHYYVGFWNGNPQFSTSGNYEITNSGDRTSESYSWTSGTVNTNVFDGWEDAKVKIPHSVSGLSPGWTIPDFTNAINDLWNRNLQGQIVIEDTDQPVPPPPVPVPSIPLGDVPFDDWVDLWGQGIYEQLENQSDALDFIGSNGSDAIEELENIDENIGALEETAESIDTNIGVGNGILGGIRSLAQSAVNYLEGIAENVGELVEEIVEGTETLIAGILNQIPQVFSVILGPIKQASSIWHYVVEWIQSIGAPFQFIWSMASGTSYYIILPVYASLAAAVVLAFYKRFGK